jgi:hypothetical protein
MPALTAPSTQSRRPVTEARLPKRRQDNTTERLLRRYAKPLIRQWVRYSRGL